MQSAGEFCPSCFDQQLSTQAQQGFPGGSWAVSYRLLSGDTIMTKKSRESKEVIHYCYPASLALIEGSIAQGSMLLFLQASDIFPSTAF